MPKLLKSGELSEESIHKTVIQWVELQPFVSLVIHYPNEGKRTPRYGKKLKDMGMRKGVWDLFIAMPKRGYGGAWIELKTNEGRLSKEQKDFGERMTRQNYFTAVTRGIDESIEVIKWYCLKD